MSRTYRLYIYSCMLSITEGNILLGKLSLTINMDIQILQVLIIYNMNINHAIPYINTITKLTPQPHVSTLSMYAFYQIELENRPPVLETKQPT